MFLMYRFCSRYLFSTVCFFSNVGSEQILYTEDDESMEKIEVIDYHEVYYFNDDVFGILEFEAPFVL